MMTDLSLLRGRSVAIVCESDDSVQACAKLQDKSVSKATATFSGGNDISGSVSVEENTVSVDVQVSDTALANLPTDCLKVLLSLSPSFHQNDPLFLWGNIGRFKIPYP